MSDFASKFGRYKVDASTGRVSKDDVVRDPGMEVYRPATPEVIGPTRLYEWLMVDLRVAKLVEPGTPLHVICQELGLAGSCGVVASTLVIDLAAASPRERALLLDQASWPTP